MPPLPPRRAGRAASITVDLVEDDGDWSQIGDLDGLIRRAADAVAAGATLAPEAHSVTVALSSDAHVAELNGRYRAKPKPTNVLSFPAAGPAAPGFLGDIILAVETIQREAREQETPLADHIQHLVIHGILHLLGYDHLTDEQAEEMEAIEIVILSSLGVANPYTTALEPDRKD